jgi:hypothetical protein
LAGSSRRRPGAASYNSSAGFKADDHATNFATDSTARHNATGYQATWESLLVADNTNANNSGNTTNYSPGTSGTEGNFSALIRWS